MLLAELHISNEDFPEARRALGDLNETAPTTRTATLIAAIERGEGAGDAVVKGWLARALNLPRGPQWICDNCQHIHAEWAPICENCESFDTLAWKTPPAAEMVMPGGAQMLPLIVGAIEDKSAEPADATDDIEDAELLPEDDTEVSPTADSDAPEVTQQDTAKAS